MDPKPSQDPLSGVVIRAAIDVHRALGPGLMESAYEACLAQELRLSGIGFRTQAPLPVHYRGLDLECGYRMDMVVEGTLLVEIKAVEKLEPIHDAQVLTYLRLSGLRTGLLINFHVPLLRDGLKRFAL